MKRVFAIILLFVAIITTVCAYIAIALQPPEYTDEQLIKLATVEVSNCPNNLSSILSSCGWNIKISHEDLKGDVTMYGYADVHEKVIYITDNAEYMSSTIYHEVGHAFDVEAGGLSWSPMWQGLYSEECKNLTYTFEMVNPQEYFAEAFRIYCKENDRLQSSCPKTYEYMKTVLQKFEGLYLDT